MAEGDSLQLFPAEGLPDPLQFDIPGLGGLLAPPQTPRQSALGLPPAPIFLGGTTTGPRPDASPPPPRTWEEAMMGHESGGKSTAKNPLSSAYGPGQFIDSTWRDFIKARPELFANMTPEEQMARRSDPMFAKLGMQWYAGQNAPILQKAGIDATGPNISMAHRFGPQGAIRVIQAPAEGSIRDYVSSEDFANNQGQFIEKGTGRTRSVGEVRGDYANDPNPTFLGSTTSEPAATPQGAPGIITTTPQDPIDIKALTTLSLLRALLPAGMGFHQVDYDPIIKGVLRQGHQEVSPALHGMPSMFPDQRQQIQRGGEPAYSPAKIIQDQLAAHLRRTR